ncbi:MAG: tRNA pseudouridine(13) synthase TruD [Candidatus Bathyarchaeia archaeon]
MQVPRLERELGMEVYASRSPGVDGWIRQFPEDFVVEEVLVDGTKAEVRTAEIEPPTGIGRYLVCLLIKRDWDTLLAIREVAKQLGMSHERIQIAGMKDAKALTAQHITISRITPDQLSQVKIKDVALHPLYYSSKKVSSKLLLGNQFHILVRGISHAPDIIKHRIEGAQSELSNVGGLPNFFGHQRFGTIRPITHLVGRFLVQEDFEKAALTFLAEPSPHEHPESREARQQLHDTGDFKEALRSFPRFLKYEHMMLSHLARQPRDFLGAFRRLPLKLRRLFVQAYQSFMFNKSLSKRIRRRIPLNTTQTGDYAVELDSHGLPVASITQVTAQSMRSVQKAIDEKKMCVAIPLIGFEQNPSGGVQGEIERELLETENLTAKDFKVLSMPEISAPGGLRTVLTPVLNPSIEDLSEDQANPSKRALKLGFLLHRGSYATVLLREFMKPQDLIKAGF